MELKAIEDAEKLRKMEEELEAQNAKVIAERKRKYVHPPVRFSAPVLKPKARITSKGFLRELPPMKFHALRKAIKSNNASAFHELDVGFGSSLTWTDTVCSCTFLDRFSADRKYQYTFLDGAKEQRYEKYHPYLPSRHREFTVLDYCHHVGATAILNIWHQEQSETAKRWEEFEQAKKEARRCAGCHELVGDLEEHVFLTPPADPSRTLSAEMTRSRYYHLPCCRCEDGACGIVLDSDNFFLVDIQWGRNPPGPTILCRKHKLKQELEKTRWERKKAAEKNEAVALQMKTEALRSKNPNDWVQVEVDESADAPSGDSGERQVYWLHKKSGYTQWETPPVIQQALDQQALNEQQRTIYVQSSVPERDRYLEDIKSGVAGRKSVVEQLVPDDKKDREEEAEKLRRLVADLRVNFVLFC